MDEEHNHAPSDMHILQSNTSQYKQTKWPESVFKLYRLSNCCLSAKLVPIFADRGVSHSQRGRSPVAVISIF
jgi:hypothetical protein